ncbi:hypothetical protein [Altererythrobacter sp. C41]|uniref:hypothetical protein n=1 Tax=Altererythrobacter sp. C41 TaxID=2806021 RepID=UPI0019340058|nr:hypothetical protein [Altererythrobacter sp. C41]MBM0168661.1 hypothetical protein [Altererythrobacter sp. C41]
MNVVSSIGFKCNQFDPIPQGEDMSDNAQEALWGSRESIGSSQMGDDRGQTA